VIPLLAGWQINAAVSALEAKQASMAGTPEFETAQGLLEAERGEYDRALSLLQGAADKAPADPAPPFFRGEVLYWQRKHSEANAAWREAHTRARARVEAAPEDLRAQFYLGASLNRQQKPGQAREALQKALAGGWEPAMTRYQIGFAYMYEQQWQQAKEAFDASIEADPRFAHSYYYRGLAWDKLGRTDNMLIDMDQFLKLAPTAPEASRARTVLAASGR
jgi:tetratricopeptide (TPR) repeat protein